MLDLSIGELDALVVKAYRGAGFSWGYAQEAGATAAWLAMRGLPSAVPFALLLPSIEDVHSADLSPVNRDPDSWSGSGKYLCPVITGCVLSDFGLAEVAKGAALTIHSLLYPVLLVPAIARLPGSYELQINQTRVRCGQHNVELICGDVNTTDTESGNVTIDASDPVSANLAVRQRVEVDVSTLDVLQSFAHRTYVPATEASRLAGAGAGLLDND